MEAVVRMRLSAAKSRSVKRIGIIGAGAAAALHLTALRKIDGVRVVAIRDINTEKATALTVSFGLPPHIADPSQFYEAEPQSIHIATPPYAHEDLARDALDHGVHVLIEKPPSLTLGGCEALLRLARARSLAVGVNENTALDPLIRRGRAAIEAGSLGQVLHIDGFYTLGMRDGEQPPRWVEGLPGGMLEDLLPHLLTTARALTGVRLTPEYWRLASTGAIAGQPYDELRLFLTGDEKLTVNLALSLSARPKAFVLTARGTRAMLAIDLRNMLLQLSRPDPRGGAIGVGAELVRTAVGVLSQTTSNAAGLLGGYRQAHGSFLPLIRAHYAALEAGTEIPAPLERAIETVATIRAIWPLPRQEEPANSPRDAVASRGSTPTPCSRTA